MAKLNREQQRDLAAEVIDQIANILDRDDAHMYGDPETVRAQLATWAARLPGTYWDTRLGDPDS
jgi:hypothetical protein